MYKQANENIIKILGIDSLSLDKQKEAMEKLGAIVYQETMLRVLEILSEEDKNEFEKVIAQNPDPENLFSFLSEKVPNLDEIISEEAEKLRAESAEIIDEIGK